MHGRLDGKLQEGFYGRPYGQLYERSMEDSMMRGRSSLAREEKSDN